MEADTTMIDHDKPLILLVDDTPSNIHLLADMLQKEYRLKLATGGQEALRLVSGTEERPDLVLLDVMMPHMSGFEVCSKLKAEPDTAEIPVIFITVLQSMDDIAKGFKVGGADYVTKPFNTFELLARVGVHVEARRSKRKIREAYAMRGELLHILAHDLKSPLADAAVGLEIAKMDPRQADRVLSIAKNALVNSLDMIDLVQNYLAFESGMLRLDLKPVSLTRVVETSRGALADKFKTKNIRLVVEDPGGVWATAESVSLVNTVVNNLLTNALKFSQPGSTVVVRITSADGRAVLTVADQGIGIPAATLDALFDVTKPASRKGTSGEIGTGFGMPLVKKFVEAYGGAIDVMSKDSNASPVDHGTEVRVTLPLAQAPGR